ncbi:MAG: hypothetical protein LH606_12785 [Cytophagaceae bacterium]|nr:hypothetical protein [Cytophagaceae bacterium]
MNLKRKSMLVTTLLLAIGLLGARAQDVQTALRALDAERFAAARTMFKQMAASNSAESQFYLGYFYLRTANVDSSKRAVMLDSAKMAFDKGVATDAKSALNMVGQGGVALAGKNLAEGKAKITQALDMTKNRDENVMWRAAEMYTLFEKGGATDPAEAIRLVDAIGVLKKKTERPDYQIVKGDAFLIRNDGGNAVTAYEEALRLNTDNSSSNIAKIQTRIGKVFKRGKNYVETQKGFLNAIQADSNYAPVYQEFGELWLMAGDYKRAAQNYRKYLEKSEGTPEDRLRYAKFAFLSKDYSNAVAQLDQIKGKLKDTDINRMYGYSYVELNKPDLGVENLQQLLQALPDDKELSTDYGYLGRGYSMLEADSAGRILNDSLSLQFLSKAAPADTNNNYFANIAEVKFKKKDYKGAAEAYQQSVDWKEKKSDEKPSPNDYLSAGRSYYFAYATAPKESRDSTLLPRADSAFVKLAELVPEFAAAQLWRGRTNALMDPTGVKEQAKPFYEKYIELQKDTATAGRRTELAEANKRLAYYAQVKQDMPKATEHFTNVRNYNPADKDAENFFNPPAPPAAAVKPAAKPKAKPGAKPAPKKKVS